ncbi:MAG: hypothetical protein HY423_13585 [Candidatus Lambdaproteobacteria bacterium]|nr:hypothetical protein [Candidatus Lambdaproteobacteria bacterium]
MTELANHVAELVKLNGGSIIGKTRLQKTVFLLERLDLGFGFEFDYHNFGPFSVQLANSADDAEQLLLIQGTEKPGFHEIPYTTFSILGDFPEPKGNENSRRKDALAIMEKYSALVLELAATAEYLRINGYREDYWDELRRRKPLKATSERINLAKRLLDDLGLLGN